MGQGKYERNWQDALEGAEMTPSDSVWTGIEAAVANGEAARYKRKVIFYKWMAAAGILLFVGLLGYLSFQNSQFAAPEIVDQLPQNPNAGHGTDETTKANSAQKLNETNSSSLDIADKNIAANERGSAGEDEDGEGFTESSRTGNRPSTPAALSTEDKHLSNSPQAGSSTVVAEATGTLDSGTESSDPKTVEADQSTAAARKPAAVDQRTAKDQNTLPAVVTDSGQISDWLAMNLTTAEAVIILAVKPLGPHEQMLQLSDSPQHLFGVALHPTKRHMRAPERKLWAGLNMAPGYFDPNYQISNLESASQALGAASGFTPTEATNGGFSLGIAVDLGLNISRRWEVNSGIQYFRNSLQSSTNAAINQTPVFSSVVESLDLANNKGSVRFAPTDLDNDFQFISIPLEAGYRVFDNKIQLTVNGGIAADIFLKNTISPTDKSLEQVTISPGANSPFRTVYFNGILGAQVSYEIMPRYQITLQPQYRMALNQFTKPDNSYTSLPSAFGIGVGIKYNFK